MNSPEIVLSFNEILFFFTRAAVGVGVPFGLAEDFGRSSMWIASSGLDPAQITAKALQFLDCGQSSLYASQTENGTETVMRPSSGKQLSALLAGPAVCDWISAKTEDSNLSQHFVAKKVDYPFLIAAAAGTSNYGTLEICWQDSGGSLCTVLTGLHGSWKTSWGGTEIAQKFSPADVSIKFVESSLFSSEKWNEKKTYSEKNKKSVLESGVPVYEAWPIIHTFFSRCLVPSTEESRKSGAGAGLVDTD